MQTAASLLAAAPGMALSSGAFFGVGVGVGFVVGGLLVAALMVLCRRPRTSKVRPSPLTSCFAVASGTTCPLNRHNNQIMIYCAQAEPPSKAAHACMGGTARESNPVELYATQKDSESFSPLRTTMVSRPVSAISPAGAGWGGQQSGGLYPGAHGVAVLAHHTTKPPQHTQPQPASQAKAQLAPPAPAPSEVAMQASPLPPLAAQHPPPPPAPAFSSAALVPMSVQPIAEASGPTAPVSHQKTLSLASAYGPEVRMGWSPHEPRLQCPTQHQLSPRFLPPPTQDIDPEWGVVLGDLDSQLAQRGEPPLIASERAVAVRRLIGLTGSRGMSFALKSALDDVMRARHGTKRTYNM